MYPVFKLRQFMLVAISFEALKLLVLTKGKSINSIGLFLISLDEGSDINFLIPNFFASSFASST